MSNPARPAPGTLICALKDIAHPGARVFDYTEGSARFSLLVVRTQAGDIAAYENVCPHARFPLERPDGRVVIHEKRFVVCATHGASFRLEDGRCVAGPGLGTALSVVPVTVLGRDIRIA